MPTLDRDTLESLSTRLVAAELGAEALTTLLGQLASAMTQIAIQNVNLKGQLFAGRALMTSMFYDIAKVCSAKDFPTMTRKGAVKAQLELSMLMAESMSEALLKLTAEDDNQGALDAAFHEAASDFMRDFKFGVEALRSRS